MIYVVTGLPRSGTSYLMRCLQAGGCKVIRKGRHKHLEIHTTYLEGTFPKIISKCGYGPFVSKKNYCIKVFSRYLPLLKYRSDVHPILVVRDYNSLKTSHEKRGMQYPCISMGKKYLEDYYDLYYQWLKENWPHTEKIIFPHFDKWAAKTSVPVKIIPYVKRRDG